MISCVIAEKKCLKEKMTKNLTVIPFSMYIMSLVNLMTSITLFKAYIQTYLCVIYLFVGRYI